MDNLSAPKKEELPDRIKRIRLGGAKCKEIKIGIQTITPILGGGTTARMLDSVDIIRVPTIRGHLRFWWRALYGHRSQNDAEALYRQERELWGGADRDGTVKKSSVEISIGNCRPPTNIEIDSGDPMEDKGTSYALWPARGQNHGQAAWRLKHGYTFNLQLVFSPLDHNTEDEIRNVLRAWILFGEYGSRTRRGVGSITVRQEADQINWLPAASTRESLVALFNGDDILAPVKGVIPSDMPSIRAGALIAGNKSNDAMKAWQAALGWLRNFRQGTDGKTGDKAREPDPYGGLRDSFSNWPEADKIRQFSSPKPGKTWAHSPRYNKDPAWPRASFGLPIIGKYQEKSRVPHPTRKKNNGRADEMYWGELSPPQDEPGEFELRWSPNGPSETEDNAGSRLASPLIVKALPLADGQFVPCAIWLNRTYPDGKVLLGRNIGGSYSPVPGSSAPFDKITGSADTLRFNPLVGKPTVRDAFLDWLAAKSECTRVAP